MSSGAGESPLMAIYAVGGGMIKIVEWSLSNPGLERALYLTSDDARELYELVQQRGFESEMFARGVAKKFGW